MKNITVVFFVILFSFPVLISAQEEVNQSAASSNPASELDAFFSKTISENNFVGLSACLIKNNKIVWLNSYGYADLEEKKPVRPTDIFQIASLSKVVTATAIMQLYDKGLFKLDDDINSYMPVSVRHPGYPDKPITFRMLLTHTEAFDDVLPAGNKILLGVKGDHPLPLKEYVEQLFTPGGKFYSADFFAKHEPGTQYKYSNIGFSLIGYLVENISGMDFEEYCKANIFKPLEMNNTAWHLKDLDTSRIVYCYGFRGNETAVFKKTEHFGTPGYPEGMLRTTLQDFTNFISAYLNDGMYNGYRLLKPETIDLMLSPQVSNIPNRSNKTIDMGLTWNIVNHPDGDMLYTMNGFSGSIFALAQFSRKDKTGIMYFYTGITMKTMPAVNVITQTLTDYVKKF